ncbi:PLP-dependent aminotransferase family protein [Actinophytocola glycyrrhizae]|uniref:PLP-dependent aminotransferase family protein n=1 Tax=Actinophytocola glycyrrhizae TaxID=2044873 RepID=A0ABV9RVK1_9PSEU
MDDYRLIADRVADDIAARRLRAGEQLPPQRRFARQHGIAASTAARVYGELVRRGLAVGEVGRGTFVRSSDVAPEPALSEPARARVDLELNFPVLPDQAELLSSSLARLLRPDVLAETLRPSTVDGTPRARAVAARLLARTGWIPEPDRIQFAGNGRQAIAAAVAALVPVGGRLGVEAMTYPVVKAVAARLGVTLVPLAMDEQGLLPSAVREASVRAVYVQPTLHNPLGITMPDERRTALAEVLTTRDLPAIEDGIYNFLRDDRPPLAALAPDHVTLVDSMSKRIAPGLTLGYLVPPAATADALAGAIRSGGWAATGFALEAATQCVADGTAETIVAAKRADAAARQRLVAQRLADFAVHADPGAFHCWWELPEPWRAETFVAAAARLGIAVTPAAAFAVGQGRAPNAVRLALSAPPPGVLASTLDTLAKLARTRPEDATLD